MPLIKFKSIKPRKSAQKNENTQKSHSFLAIAFFRGICLKGPKLEIFGSEVFALIRPVWISDLGSRPKISKS